MGFILGSKSLAELEGVDSRLVAAVKRAIQITAQDFSVADGIRTIEEQKRHVANGTSKTMRSKHLTGRAVDLVPYIDGKLSWDWPAIYLIAAAMRTASIDLSLPLVWGGCWDRRLADLPADAAGLQAAQLAYNARHPGPDFPDGPHYEIPDGV